MRWLELGDDSTYVGTVYFKVGVSSTGSFPAFANWTQLVDRKAYNNGVLFKSTTGVWLDNDPLFNTVSGVLGAPPANTSVAPNGTVFFWDNPGVPSNIWRTSCTDKFSTYLVFQPAPTNTSIWVPLGIVNWGWSAGETAYNLTSTNVTIPTLTTNSVNFPFWTNRLFSR